MERLKYIVEDSTIAELLGVQNFTNKESAILERVKTMFSNNVNLNQIVAFVNSKTLESDLTTEEISRLNTIRVKLIGRRK